MSPALRAFRHRNFRLFFSGQLISLLGFWLQVVAQGWLVYRLTGSALMLGLTAFAQQIPLLFLAPIAGVLAERVDRRRLLLFTQCAAGLVALALAVLTFAGVIGPWHVIALALVYGVIHGFETPTRQAFILDLVENRDDLPNAIALQSTLFNTARFAGPSLAGLVLAATGEAWCFLLNAVSYLATIIAYSLVRVPRRRASQESTHWLRQLIEGFRYGYGFVGTRHLLLMVAAMSFFSAPWQPFMPKIAAETFGGTSRTLGFMLGAVGLGALCGALSLARRSTVVGLGRALATTATISGIAFAAFSQSRDYWLSLALLVVFGFGLVFTIVSCNTVLQTITDEGKRSRVISLHVMSIFGAAPLGNFVWAHLSEHVGVHWTILTCGLGMAGAGLTFAAMRGPWRRAVREVYVRQGMLPASEE